jgi:hypothetical protein
MTWNKFVQKMKRPPTSNFSNMKTHSTFSLRAIRVSVSRLIPVLLLTATLCSAPSLAGESDTLAGVTNKVDATNAMETLRAYLQVQEQLHATQMAIERNRKEADEAAARNTQVLASRLEAIEQSMTSQRVRELDAMQSSNRVMLIVAGVFAAIGLLAMLLMAYFQWRTVNRLAEIAAMLPAPGNHVLGPGPAFAALSRGDAQVVSIGPAEQPDQKLLGALERLEKRIHELEHTTHPPLNETAAVNHDSKAASPQTNGDPAESNGIGTEASADGARITLLLGRGQSLLNMDNAEEALGCFDEVLKLDGNNTEALVKKGTALERLRKMDEAIDCYDRAIAADRSMTIAYLYKGGLFNRMERFTEALECYEQALRAQEKREP